MQDQMLIYLHNMDLDSVACIPHAQVDESKQVVSDWKDSVKSKGNSEVS